MKKEDIKVLLIRAPGTNCDAETKNAFDSLGTDVRLIHTQEVFRQKNLEEYDILVFPGGFSYGDYVRSGAIWAKECEYRIGKELESFSESGKPIIGICNGFQVLVEMGFLPGFNGRSNYPEAALANNSYGYQCRWTRLKFQNNGSCEMLNMIPKDQILKFPVAHGEGRFLFPPEKQEINLKELLKQDQLVFRYVRDDGTYPLEKPWANPNGAFYDIAGICNPEGNILGLMPHPERAYYRYLMPEWTKEQTVDGYGDGKIFFESIVRFVEKTF